MGEKHKVSFEPVGIEIEVDEEETILDAAFRHGVMLMHGCKEGQCSACKSFLLDGDLEMDKFSTFALNESEEDEGFVLLCKAHAYSDLEIELLSFREEMLNTGVPLQLVYGEVAEIEKLTHDIRRLVMKLVDPPEANFIPGQYAELYIPGTEVHRAYSMANTPESDDRAEFIIKVYPGGRFSSMLDEELEVGQKMKMKLPFGVFSLRAKSEKDMIFIGGGSGMAPIWSILTHMVEKGVERKATYYYGARTKRDLFFLEELKEMEAKLPNFRFVPALSEPDSAESWSGETGLVTDVVKRLEGDLTGTEAYLAGPPPMVDAAIAMLEMSGVGEEDIFFDKFTTTGEVEGSEKKEESGPSFPGRAGF
ncbi:NADH:ubiquinone reductase (Na(+)-transporting) subunit F [Rubrobacter indicoceani]|uniref:NADH:ubiquinone reductase (Na(+)-transporting) subunit F n=1 Tax=Rubrobacter indicoceani TaxID=2051957 RepID=UPI000E5AD208|nr:2Fe-2S iron-sulfur cluster binding domain-containing protein [Rubrobacter indicoceani]